MTGRGRGAPPRGPSSANNRGANSRGGGQSRSQGRGNAQGGRGNAPATLNAGRASFGSNRGSRGRGGNNVRRERNERNTDQSGTEQSGNEESDDNGSPPPDASTTDDPEPTVALRILERPPQHDFKRRFEYFLERQPLIEAEHIRKGEFSRVNKEGKVQGPAIQFRGLCEDNCPEFERVRRIVENDMKMPEFTSETARGPREKRVPDEWAMVKAWKRSGPGAAQVLPSLVRTPDACLRSAKYLMSRIDEDGLEFTYSWLWDRTRAVRIDLNLEAPPINSTTPVYLRVYEMIVRWHLMAAHGMSLSGNMEFSHAQDLEQLKATYTSLGIRYMEARQAHIPTPHEAEMMSYAILTTIDHKRSPNPGPWGPAPGVLDRLENEPQIKTAMKVLRAANGMKEKSTKLSIYREKWLAFWRLIASDEVTYLMACAAEVGFNLVRYHILSALYRIYKKHGDIPDMRVSRLVDLMGFDEEAQVRSFCKMCAVPEVKQDNAGEVCIDFGNLNDSRLETSEDKLEIFLPCDFGDKPQFFSQRLVEAKRPPNASWVEITAGPDPDPDSLFIPDPRRNDHDHRDNGAGGNPFSQEVLDQLPPIPPPDTNPFGKRTPSQQATSITNSISPFAVAAAAARVPNNPNVFEKMAAAQGTPSTKPFSPFSQPAAALGPFGMPLEKQALQPANGSPFGQPSTNVMQAELPNSSPFAQASLSNGSSANQSSPFTKPASRFGFVSPGQGALPSVTPGVWDPSKPINFAPQNGTIAASSQATPPTFGFPKPTNPAAAQNQATPSHSPFQFAKNDVSAPASTSPPAQTGPSEEDLQRQKKEAEEREQKRQDDFQKQQEAERQQQLARQEAERQQAAARQQEQERQLALARQKAKEDLERRKEEERQQEIERQRAIERQRQLEHAQARQKALERGKNAFATSIIIEGDHKNAPMLQQFAQNRLCDLFPAIAYEVKFAKAEAIANERYEKKRLEKARYYMGIWYGKAMQAAYKRKTRQKASARRKWLKENKAELDAANAEMALSDIENYPPGVFKMPAAPASSKKGKKPVTIEKKTTTVLKKAKTISSVSHSSTHRSSVGAVQPVNPDRPTDHARRSLDSSEPPKSVADFVWGTPYKNPNPPIDRTDSEYFKRKIAALDAKKHRKRTRDTEEKISTPSHKRSRTSSTPIRVPYTPLPPPTTEEERLRRFREVQAKLHQSSPRESPKTATLSPSIPPPVQHEFSRSVPSLTTLPTRPAYHDRVSRFVPRHLYGQGADAVRKYYQASKGSNTASPEVLTLSSPIPTQQSYLEMEGEEGESETGTGSSVEQGYEDEDMGEYESGEMEYEDEDEEGWEFAQQTGAGPGMTQDDAIELSD
ncbi:hypothetical protein P154DRAFT_616304 [Amniculicola lignicola CBS 123094]|uniref:SAC3/GANP/THP3 conserved domain-containing protein n=1 Tax=Amniculicola lignicola CBS 123094 TaxID=1392246 RepID=A0A6A5X2I0_9PLEO|nr:hypothetical protein P154DRAFT_616304 [Amniculicola lignicola CBS 123094]